MLVDADYLDATAFDLIVNFERMLGRRIEQGDLCHWLDCIALDGGLTPGHNQVQVLFLHSKTKERLDNFAPAHFATELDGKAFSDNLGEFTMHSFAVESVVSADEFFIQSLTTLCDAKEIKHLMVVGDMQRLGQRITGLCRQTDGKDITVFAMEPLSGRGFTGEILGYSLMSALGIKGSEL